MIGWGGISGCSKGSDDSTSTSTSSSSSNLYKLLYDTSDTATEYNLRCIASGNVSDHTFQFNYRIGSNQILAKGISQGEGNYVIFKFDDGDGPYYLRASADEDEQFFKDIFDNNGVGVETLAENIEDPQGYLTWIEAQSFMEAADLLTDTAGLNSGISELEGTINLDF